MAEVDQPDSIMLAAIQAVSVCRRGSIEWSEHDRQIAESCIDAYLAAGGKNDCEALRQMEQCHQAIHRGSRVEAMLALSRAMDALA